LKILLIALVGWTALGMGCSKPQVVRKSPPPPAPFAAVPVPAPQAAPLPEALLEGAVEPRQTAAAFRKPSKRYTIVMSGADAREMFLSLARENDFNLVVAPEVNGTVTLDIKDATAEELMAEVCGMIGCRLETSGKTVRVMPARRVTRVFVVDYLVTERKGAGSLVASTSTTASETSGMESQSTNSVTTEEKGDFWGHLAAELGHLVSPDGGKAVVNPTSGTVVVTDYPEYVDRVARHLRVLEARARTGVVIEAQILEITLDDETKYGINWSALPDLSSLHLSGTLTGGATATQTLATGATALHVGVAGSKLTAFLDAQAASGNLEVLSAPKVATLNNQKAVIRIGRQDVFFKAVVTPASTTSAAFTTFTPETVTEGIILSVTPQIGRDGRILLAIHPSITEKVGDQTAPDGNTAPILDIRETNTVVEVQDGQTVFIGGLLQERTQETVTSVPILGDIPFLGALFRSNVQEKRKTELVILITPRIVRPADAAAVTASETGRQEALRRGMRVGGRPWLYGTEGERETFRPWN